MIDCVNVQPHLLFLIWPKCGLFWTLQSHFCNWGKVQNFFRTYLSRQSTSVLKVWPNLSFIRQHLGPFAIFWVLGGYLFGHLGLLLGSRTGSKIFLEPTYVDHQLWFWKYRPIFSFLIPPNLGLFAVLGLLGLFLGLVQVQKLYWNLPI